MEVALEVISFSILIFLMIRFFFFFLIVCIYLLLAVLGLRCCAGLSVAVASGGLLSHYSWVVFSLQWLLLFDSPVLAQELQSCGTWGL